MENLTNVAVQVLGPAVAFLESLSFIGVNTHFVKLAVVDSAIQPLADSIGMSLILIKYTLSLFLVYPLSAILYALPNKNAKHLFSFLVGFFLVQWIFGPDWIHSFLSSIVTYLICAIVPKKHQHLVAFVWVMGYMTGSHIYRMYVSYLSGVFDFTGTQMVLTMKLTSFAWNLYDGVADRKNVFPEKPHEDPKKAKIYNERKKFAIERLPNLLEFFGYVYCFTCLLAGPAFEYNDYVRSIDGSAFRKGEDKKIKKPSPVLPALFRLGVGVVCLVGHLQVAGRFPLSQLYNKEFIASNGYLFRWGFLCLALFGERLKYYFAWKVAEGSSILGGFGFEGYDKEGKEIGWKAVENIEIVGFETAPNVQVLSRVWNKRTQGWLERYTYNRTGRSLFATYFISAIWHGLYPGFFLFFMSIPLMTNIERLVKSKISPLIVPSYDGYKVETYPKTFVGYAYWTISWVITMAVMNYVVQVFSMGSLENSLTALGSYHYIPHIAMVVIYVILEVVPLGKKSGGKKKE